MRYTIVEVEKHFEAQIDFALAGEPVVFCVGEYTSIQLLRIGTPALIQPSNAGAND